MAAPTNTTSTYNNVGQRENLTDLIDRVSPEKTPFLSSIGKAKATARRFEWQTEALDAVNAGNAQLEGNKITTFSAPNLTSRVGNIVQIMSKDGSVTGTADAVEVAGRDKEFNRQKLVKGASLKRDKESIFIANQGSYLGDIANARTLGGAMAWATTTSLLGASGVNGGYNSGTGLVAAATNGDLRTLTEAMITSAMQSLFDSGAVTGQSMNLLTKSALKSKISTFAGISLNRNETNGKLATIVAGADVYLSDFGPVVIIAHAYAPDLARNVMIYDADAFSDAVLRPMESVELAKNGDSREFLITHETTLQVKNEKSIGVIRDVQAT